MVESPPVTWTSGIAPAGMLNPINTVMHKKTSRILLLAFVAVAAVAFVTIIALVDARLGHASMWSGWTLLGCVGVLLALGIRKRLPMLPLIPVRIWTRIHIYTGLFSLIVYATHVPVIIASGFFESTLSLLFLGVSLSGIYGVWISRTGAKRLTAVPGEYRFEQFGWHRKKIAERAWSILDRAGDSQDLPVLAAFYQRKLQGFFTGRPSFAYVLVPTGGRRRRLLSELNDLDRYLAPSLKQASGKLAGLIRTRDDLDFHYATQLRMRLWLAIHLAMTSATMGFIVVHVLMALQFRGG